MTVFPDIFFKQKHLKVISENRFRGELILFIQSCSRNWQGFKCIDDNIFHIYIDTVETELKVTQSALAVHMGCTPFVKD